MVNNPLSNKLKQLRISHNLSTTVLADQFGVSSTHIHYLDNNKRGVSDELLQKYADFFKVPFEELKELQNKTSSDFIYPTGINQASDYEVDELLKLILAIEEPLRGKFIEDCKQKLQDMFFNLLTPYSLTELKKLLTNLRDNWYSVDNYEIQPFEMKGNLKFPDQDLYFNILVDNNQCIVEILYEDQNKIDHFSRWLTEPDCNITIKQKIPHLKEEQKLKIYYWFSPNISIKEQFKLLKEKHHELNHLNAKSFQLTLLVKNTFFTEKDEAI
ncbi:helix-turn-helix transcriptional regulator [Cytobacillus firmus]|uniref:helix-turn-helix transcriptional regulator n=1 Tax=Cytobacillus firmus TaxID=1399 RepID=UPI0018CF7C5F|nr:helix-turn-helix transcriptional regulator [Cytobacillus firmus]MBG9588306.1 hypothetical protein [Cytobacillus firmus]